MFHSEAQTNTQESKTTWQHSVQTQRLTGIHSLLKTHTKKAHKGQGIPMVLQVHHSTAAASFARLGCGKPTLCLQHVGPSRTFRVQQNVTLQVNSSSLLTLKLSRLFNVL